jgi:hypothetical protein
VNAIVIEQTAEEAKLAIEVHQNAAIQRIRLARAKLTSQAVDEIAKSRVGVTFQFKSKPLSGPADVLRLEIAFRMEGVEETDEPAEKKPSAVLLVDCAYEVDYALRDGFEITAERIKAFKDGNAIFNVWPFFREYLQNSLVRMGMPPLIAPFLRLEQKEKARKRAMRELQDPQSDH